MEYTYILFGILGLLVIEQFVVIILLIVQNSNLKKCNTGAPVINTNYSPQASRPAAPAAPRAEQSNTSRFASGIMMCRKCYNPVKLPNKKCTCCGQTMILR